jgi:predicted DsbA family dithiol-disulfide isomerase
MIWAVIGDIGLDMTKARADADGSTIDPLLRQDIADMQALKVDRPPGVFVNGTPSQRRPEAT